MRSPGIQARQAMDGDRRSSQSDERDERRLGQHLIWRIDLSEKKLGSLKMTYLIRYLQASD
jgi:hypothetical protein